MVLIFFSYLHKHHKVTVMYSSLVYNSRVAFLRLLHCITFLHVPIASHLPLVVLEIRPVILSSFAHGLYDLGRRFLDGLDRIEFELVSYNTRLFIASNLVLCRTFESVDGLQHNVLLSQS